MKWELSKGMSENELWELKLDLENKLDEIETAIYELDHESVSYEEFIGMDMQSSINAEDVMLDIKLTDSKGISYGIGRVEEDGTIQLWQITPYGMEWQYLSPKDCFYINK